MMTLLCFAAFGAGLIFGEFIAMGDCDGDHNRGRALSFGLVLIVVCGLIAVFR